MNSIHRLFILGKRFFSAILLFLLPVFLFAQTGKVFDNLSMTSKILKGERKYAVYLPPDYADFPEKLSGAVFIAWGRRRPNRLGAIWRSVTHHR